MGIKHFEDLNLDQMISFCEKWKDNPCVFDITEKFDGNFMSFGVGANGIFLSSKNKLFKSVNDIPNIFFFDAFKKCFSELEKSDFINLAREVARSKNISIVGEFIDNHEHNVIQYCKDKIKDGVFVAFGSNNLNKTEAEQIFDKLNEKSKIKFIWAPNIDLSGLQVNEKLVKQLKNIKNEHGDFLAKAARNQLSKALKKEILLEVKRMGEELKVPFLGSVNKSLLGDESEGFVFSSKVFDIAFKVVDRISFNKKKERYWYFINCLNVLENEYNQNKALNHKKSLQQWSQGIELLEKLHRTKGMSMLGNKRKYFESQQAINLSKQRLNEEVVRWKTEEIKKNPSFLNKLILRCQKI